LYVFQGLSSLIQMHSDHRLNTAYPLSQTASPAAVFGQYTVSADWTLFGILNIIAIFVQHLLHLVGALDAQLDVFGFESKSCSHLA
jgi:hypothetical protein